MLNSKSSFRAPILAGSITAVLTLATPAAFADTISSSADVRVLSIDPGVNHPEALSLYNDGGGNIQRTFLNFDLSPYNGNSITSDATLTLTAGIYGDFLTGVSLGTANSAWTQAGITWNNQPGITPMAGAANPGGTFGSGPVTWNIPWYMLEKMATAGSGYNYGLGIISGVGSTQHFQSTGSGGPAPTLTFSAATAASSTWTGGDGNWTAAANWAGSTVAQGIDQTATINGGSAVNITMDANRSVGALSFSGANHTISAGAGKLALNVTTGSPAISVDNGRTAVIGTTLVGLDGFTKTGAGTLSLSGANTYTGATNITGGMLRVDVTAGAARRFDASTLGLANGANVTILNDLSGNGADAAVPGGNANPTFISNAGTGTGLGAINLLGNGGATNSQALSFTQDTNVRSIFSIFKGSSFPATDSGSYSLHRPSDNNPADPLLVNYGQVNYLGTVYVNGLAVNPTVDAMPTGSNNGYNLVEMIGNGTPISLDSFNKDRIYHSGDQSQGEVIIFDTVVSEAQRLQVEAYLNRKWFGIGPGVGNLLPTTTAVTISGGGTFDVSGENYQTVASISGTDASGTRINLGAAALTFGDANNNTFDGVISGFGGSLTKQGSGTQTFSGANTYTGGTTINGGTLQVTNGGALGSGNVALGSAGGLTFDTSGASYFLNGITITGTGTMNVMGGNTLVFGAGPVNVNLSAGAQINLQSGSLESSSSFNGHWTSNQASLDVAGGAVLGLKENQVVVNALTGSGTVRQDHPLIDGNTSSLVVGIANGSGTFSGQIVDNVSAASVLKTGTGTQTFSGANTYTGGTTVNGGTLVYQNTYASSAHSIASGANLEFNVASGTRDSASTNFSGAGTLVKSGSGELRWGAGAATFSMGSGSLIDVQGGTFTVHPFDNGEMTIRDEATVAWPRTRENITAKLARYYASISYWDAHVGRIIQALKDAGEYDNTLIIIAGDNGLSLGEQGLTGKQNVYQNGGMHVPLVFLGPGIPAGRTDAFAYLMDVFPTVCDLLGTGIPRGLDAKSLAPVILGRASKVRDTAFTCYTDVQRSLRDGRWQFIRYPKINRSQLFDLQNDPHELKDLANDPAQAGKVAEFMIQLAKEQKEYGDTCLLTSANPADAKWSPPPPTPAETK